MVQPSKKSHLSNWLLHLLLPLRWQSRSWISSWSCQNFLIKTNAARHKLFFVFLIFFGQHFRNPKPKGYLRDPLCKWRWLKNLIAIRFGQVRAWLTSSFLGQADQENHFLDDFLQEIYPVCLSFSVACFFSCRQFQTLLSVWSSCVSLFHPKTVFLSMFEKRKTRHRRNHITEKTHGRKDEAVCGVGLSWTLEA